MSDISNIGSRNIQQTTLNQGVNTPDKSGDLGGHSVTQAQVAQTPARGSGIGDKIANFFTSTLPKFFSSVGESISNFFSRLTAPTQQATPQPTGTQTQTTGTQQTAPTGQTQEQKAPLQTLYDAILREATTNPNKGTFLRTDNPSSPVIKSTLAPLANTFAQTVFNSLPQDQVVGFRVSAYDDRTKFGQVKTANDEQKMDILKSSVDRLMDTWGTIYGTNDMSTTELAKSVPQNVKDLLATAFNAIDDSPMAPEDKQVAKQRVISDTVLRGIAPKITTFNNGQPGMNPLMQELGSMMLSVSNGVPDVNHMGNYMPQLQGLLDQKVEGTNANKLQFMQNNMFEMFTKAASEGVPYSPTTSKNDDLILTMDEVKQLTTTSPTPDKMSVSQVFNQFDNTDETKL